MASAAVAPSAPCTPPTRFAWSSMRRRFTIRRLTVIAGAAPSRTTWAATNGYIEAAGTEILDVRFRATDLDGVPFPSIPSTPGRTAGFDDDIAVDGPVPELPAVWLLGAPRWWAGDDGP